MSAALAILPVAALLVTGCGGQQATPDATASPPPIFTATPNVTATPIATAAPSASETPAVEAVLETVNLAAFAEVWSSGDVQAIRAFYAEDAAYVSAEQAVALQRQEPVSVFVADDTFAERVRERQGSQMRILGQPIQVFDKLVGFAFRWEEGVEGHNGVALLRYEGDKIWLHTYAVSPERTPNPAADAVPFEPVDLTALMEAWSAGDVSAVRGFYTATDDVFVVFNDEDIAFSLRGALLSPRALAGDHLSSEVLTNAAQWGMRTVGQPLRLGDLVLCAWSWEAFDYPVGYGVRFMRYEGDKIATDIRYAIRPWEAQGRTFASGL